MHAALVICLALVSAPRPTDTALVCPDEFLPALQPWIEHRRAQGHRFVQISNTLSATQLRDEIRRQATLHPLRFVVFVGDADPLAATSQKLLARSVPTQLSKAKINVQWGSEPEIASDMPFADLDDDHIPDLAIGRLTADDPQQLAVIVKKILDYENHTDSGQWCRRLSVVAGVGDFGGIVDKVLETATKKFLTEGIPSGYAMSMTYGSWRSPYCPDPRTFRAATMDRLNEGSLFWIYIGHGQRRYLDSIRVPGRAFPIFDVDDVRELQRAGGAPIAVFLSCYAGAFDERRDCLAEELLRSPQGPVAVYGGSRVTMPYAMAVMGIEMMNECFQHRRVTLGEVVLHAKQRMAKSISEKPVDTNRAMLDAIAKVVSPAPDQLDAERMEHLLLFNLIGDPLLRMKHPQALEVSVPKSAYAGERITIVGTVPFGGRCTLELACRRDRTRQVLSQRSSFVPTNAALAAYSEMYAQANDRRWTSEVFACQAGQFQRELVVPADATGPSHVRVFVEDGGRFALGSADVYLRRSKPASDEPASEEPASEKPAPEKPAPEKPAPEKPAKTPP